MPNISEVLNIRIVSCLIYYYSGSICQSSEMSKTHFRRLEVYNGSFFKILCFAPASV